MTITGPCRLCDKTAELQESHIIPRFVFKHQKETSATGFIRSSESINQRAQDGEKHYWLCKECESLFNRWETPFATHIYHAWNQHRETKQQYEYGDWLLPFACSVSWRALTWYMDISEADKTEYSDMARTQIRKALIAWKDFMLGKRPHPGEFQQHMFLFDAIEHTDNPKQFPPNMNRFLTRGSYINLAHSKGYPLFIFVKMARITLLGFLGIEHPRQWVGSQIHVQGGHIGGNIVAPVQFLEYLKERAAIIEKQQSLLSERQKSVIDRSISKNPDKAANSEVFEMMQRDIDMFGTEAVFNKKKIG